MLNNTGVLFPTSLMGSWIRSPEILLSTRKYRREVLPYQEYADLIQTETKRIVALQESLGLDVITDGELWRDNFCSFVADKINGIQLMSMSEMLDVVENKEAFENILKTLDVPASSIRNAVCVGKLSYKQNLALDEYLFVKELTDKPIKVTLPGPYILTRSMWLPELSKAAYNNKEELAEDVIEILSNEVLRLQENGVKLIQFDEPVLTEIVFTEGKPRTFMCGALAERKDPTEELAFAASLIKRVIDNVDKKLTTAALHMCRGNWSSDESTLLAGPYTPLIPTLEASGAKQLVLEFATERAGELDSLFSSEQLKREITLGLGVVNPRIEKVETVEEIVSKVEDALRFIPKERIWLNPDCGFASFANRPVNEEEIAVLKIKNMVAAAKYLREKYAD